ncbi:primosomal protein N' [Buchnera aphidicola]|uniref:replication restart helicase PriA n=1 Tax=Buchnera aphidicola TaxID=9 RepID=UPI0034640F5F
MHYFFFLKSYFIISIDIMHSDLSDKIFLKLWFRTKNGQNSIIIGTKKSIFLPFLHLGLIIVYEEHSINYKTLDRFKCSIRDISIFRAYKENIPIILDSKTPSLKTLYNIFQKKCFWINFYKKNNNSILKHEIIDLKKEKVKINLSETLINEIFKNIKKNFSVLLIFNTSDFIFLGLICSHCRWIAKCKICDDYYEIKKNYNIVFCKNCLIYFKKPLFCQNCNFFPLKKYNFGIKKIKKDIKKIFYNIPLLFLIHFNNKKNKKLNPNYLDFSVQHSGIIITTEKIVQNYYFSNIGMIGLLNTDHYFSIYQFYNIERFHQFYFNLVNLIQKKYKCLKIFIQTFLPDNRTLTNISNKKYLFFAHNILNLRKKFFLPPWNCQAILYSKSKNFKKSFIFLKFIYTFLKKKSKKDDIFLWFVGPYPIFSKSKKEYFFKLLIQCSSNIYLHNLLNTALEVSENFIIFNSIKWHVEFDIN